MFKEERVCGRAKVTTDEDGVLRGVWREIKSIKSTTAGNGQNRRRQEQTKTYTLIIVMFGLVVRDSSIVFFRSKAINAKQLQYIQQ